MIGNRFFRDWGGDPNPVAPWEWRKQQGSVAKFSSLFNYVLSILRKEQMNPERLKGSHFPKCIVLQAVYWYLRYSLSYRDIEELMQERGVDLDHSTLQRWVVKYTPMVEA